MGKEDSLQKDFFKTEKRIRESRTKPSCFHSVNNRAPTMCQVVLGAENTRMCKNTLAALEEPRF